MRKDRHLYWNNCANARDIGGLVTSDGANIRWKQLVRADSLDRLNASGWQALRDYGIRTIIDLRNDHERDPYIDDAATGGMNILHLPHDGIEDREFWTPPSGKLFVGGTPLYYRDHLIKMPERSARVLKAISDASDDGGILIHCIAGRDRTGMITLLLLAMLGVPAEQITEDYHFSDLRLRTHYASTGQRDPAPLLMQYLATQGTSAKELISEMVSGFDYMAHLRRGGLDDNDVKRLRSRFLESQQPG